MPAPACKPRCSGARQVFSWQDLFRPRLEEPVLSICSSAGKGVTQLLCLTSPLSGLASSLLFPQKRGRSSPHPGEVSRGAAGGKSPRFMPAPPARVTSPSLSPVPPGRTPPVQGSCGPGGFPTEEPEQFGKAVTSLWPGENGM